MCAPSPPPPPDYSGAAREQGAANLEAARASSRLSNPSIYTPYGNRIVTYNGDDPTVTQTYSPELKAIYDTNLRGQQGLANLGEQAIGRVGGILGQDVSFGGAPAAPGSASATRDKVINAMMARVDTDLGRRRDSTNSDLVARGIPRGSEAYNREMEMIDRARTDALNQAQLSAGSEASRDFGLDMDRRRQAITELLAQRQIPLNEISALRSGSQVAPLQFQNYSGVNAAPAPVFGAAQAQYGAAGDAYNAQAQQSGNTMSGLFSLGAAALPLMFSDRRLKTNIRRIGTHPLGIGFYAYTIFGEASQGVMADEVLAVRPEAVKRHENGFLMVDYGALS